MTQEEINKYSVLMAEFIGIEETNIELSKWRLTNSPYSKIFTKSHSKYLDFDKSYDWLIPVWVKFRDLYLHQVNPKYNILETKEKLKQDVIDDILKWDNLKTELRRFITDEPIEKAFEELGKAIEWYNTIKK